MLYSVFGWILSLEEALIGRLQSLINTKIIGSRTMTVEV